MKNGDLDVCRVGADLILGGQHIVALVAEQHVLEHELAALGRQPHPGHRQVHPRDLALALLDPAEVGEVDGRVGVDLDVQVGRLAFLQLELLLQARELGTVCEKKTSIQYVDRKLDKRQIICVHISITNI